MDSPNKTNTTRIYGVVRKEGEMTKQQSLFPDFENEWEKEWHNMPEFVMEDKEPIKQLIISFKTIEDYKKFGKLINQPLTPYTQSIWYPQVNIERYMDKRYTTDENKYES